MDCPQNTSINAPWPPSAPPHNDLIPPAGEQRRKFIEWWGLASFSLERDGLMSKLHSLIAR